MVPIYAEHQCWLIVVFVSLSSYYVPLIVSLLLFLLVLLPPSLLLTYPTLQFPTDNCIVAIVNVIASLLPRLPSLLSLLLSSIMLLFIILTIVVVQQTWKQVRKFLLVYVRCTQESLRVSVVLFCWILSLAALVIAPAM